VGRAHRGHGLELLNAVEDAQKGLMPLSLPSGEELRRPLRRDALCVWSMLLEQHIGTRPELTVLGHQRMVTPRPMSWLVGL
jgi:hypothetical protein